MFKKIILLAFVFFLLTANALGQNRYPVVTNTPRTANAVLTSSFSKEFSSLYTIPFGFAVSAGLIDSATYMLKFGNNPDVQTGTDPEDLWAGGGTYFYPDAQSVGTARVLKVSSGSETDKASANGAHTVIIEGLIAGYVETFETVAINGQTGTSTTNSWLRVNRVYVNTVGSDLTAAGIIYVGFGSLSTGVPDTAVAYIPVGENQTLQSIYTVPAGKTAYLVSWYASVDRTTGTSNASAQLQFKHRLPGTDKPFRTFEKITATAFGANPAFRHYLIPKRFVEKTDIKMVVEEVSATLNVSGGFDLILVTD